MIQNPEQLKKFVNKQIDDRERYNLYNTNPVPYHTHNGTDSPLVSFSGILGISIFTGSGNLSTEIVVLANTTDGAITLTLPNAIGNFGRQFIIKDWKGQSASKPITIQPSLGQLIDGNINKVINTNYASLYLLSDGTNWTVI